MVDTDADELIPPTSTLEDGSDSGLEDEHMRPWWEAVTANKTGILNNEQKSRKYAERLYTRVRYLHEKQAGTLAWIRKFQDLYNVVRWDYGVISSGISKAVNCTTLNLIRVGVNAVHSMIGKEMPKIGFVSEDGDYKLRDNLKMVDNYIESEFEHSELYKNVRKAVRDGALCKLGTVKVFLDDDTQKFVSEHVPPMSILVDDADQQNDRKDEVFERRIVSKFALYKKFDVKPWMKKIIDEELAYDGKVVVYEAWYRDSCHVVFTEHCILYYEPLNGKPPYFHWRWTESSDSFWGVGIADEGWTIQDNINDIDYQWLENARMYKPTILMTGNSRFTSTEVTNRKFQVLKVYGGGVGPNSVQWVVPTPMNQQQLDKRRDMVNEFMQQTGLSQFMSTGEREAGIYSGETARVVHAIQQSRFAECSQALVDMYVDIARYMLVEASRNFAGQYDSDVDADYPYKIKWSKVNIQKNYYKIKEYPMNINSMDMDARLKYIHQMMQLGVMAPQDALELFNMPDVHKYRDLITSGKRDTERRLQNIMDGKVERPNPLLPSQMQYIEAVKFYNDELTKGLKEDSNEAKGLQAFIKAALKAEQRKRAAEKVLQIQAAQQVQASQGPPQKKPPAQQQGR